jgi:Tfp pilus assembly protein PilO
MRLKVLIVPFFIVMILILGIGYIKPDFDAIQTKKAEQAIKETKVANIETVKGNIDSLNSALDTQPDTEKFMYQYLPEVLDQEQVIDAFNFLANQSGLAITKMDLDKPIEVASAPEPIAVPAPGGILSPAGLGDLEVPIVPAAPAVAKIFILKGSVAGQYENIKTFFNQVSHIERFQKIRLFSIETDTTGDTENADGNLIGTFEAEFGYLPLDPLTSALSMPVFSQAKFDTSDVDTLVTQLTSAIPTLEKGTTGKPNPFQ